MTTTRNRTEDQRQRFIGYYIDYLVNYDSIGSYAAAHKLTYKTAKYRLALAEKLFDIFARRWWYEGVLLPLRQKETINKPPTK